MHGQSNYCTEGFFPHYKIQYHNMYNYSNMSRYHFHEEHEAYFLISGERHYFVDNKSYHVQKGDLVLIRSNVRHRTSRISNVHHYERACFYFKNSFLDTLNDTLRNSDLFSCFNKNLTIIHLNENQQESLKNLVYRINYECLNEPDMYKEYIDVLLVEFLILINRFARADNNSESNYVDPKHKKIYDIINYMNEHYMEDITLPVIAKKFFISVSSLTKSFKQITGFSFTEYLNNIRIKNAYSLLDSSHYTISEIAHKVGYNSITHFGRVFKELTGYTPSQYRNTNRFLLNNPSS